MDSRLLSLFAVLAIAIAWRHRPQDPAPPDPHERPCHIVVDDVPDTWRDSLFYVLSGAAIVLVIHVLFSVLAP